MAFSEQEAGLSETASNTVNHPPTPAELAGHRATLETDSEDRPIRVTLVHPALAKYRIPVFRELSSRPGLEVRVVYGAVKGVPNVAPEGFDAIGLPRWEGRIAGKLVMYQRAEWTYCSPRYSDVVVLRWTPRSITQLPALLRARASGVATVLWGHGYSKTEQGWWRRVRNWLARQATALVFYEPRTREVFCREGWDPERLFVALNSLDNSEIDRARQWWRERPGKLAQFRRANGLDGGPIVLFVSRLQPANRVDLLIEATVILSNEIPGLKTVIIGNGPAEKRKLEELAAKLGVRHAVIFQEGIYDEMSVAPWFLSADVFCYPANVGLSLTHAFWYGLPVVTSDNLAIQNPEIIALEHGINGLTYEHGRASSLAGALGQIIEDKNLRGSMSEAARRTVEDRFTIRNMVDGLEAAIRYANKQRRTQRS